MGSKAPFFSHNPNIYICCQYTLCLNAGQSGTISPKPLCPAVVMRMPEIFLLQNKCWVGKVCKNRCLAVELATFYHKISAACALILPGI